MNFGLVKIQEYLSLNNGFFNETILIQVKEDLKLTDHSKNILHKLFKELKETYINLT